MRAKTLSRGLVGFAVAALCLASCQESLEQRAAREAKQYTAKSCPVKVDDFTVMDSMTFVPAAKADGVPTFCYWYTVEGEADRDYTPEELGQLTALLKKRVDNSTHLANYREAGYTFKYIYRSSSTPGKTLFETSVE